MKVQLVDPSAFTPPYDRALAAALARAGAEVELLTTRFLYGPVPAAEGYRVEERFYRRSAARGLEAPGARSLQGRRAPARHAAPPPRRHPPRRPPPTAPVAGVRPRPRPLPVADHAALDVHLLPPTRPRVMTAHYILPPAASRRQALPRPPRLRPHGRGRRPLRARRRPPPRRGRARSRQGPRHPPRRLRLPHPAARGEAAPGRARGRRGAGDPLLRAAASLQGNRGPARGLPPGRGGRALDRRQPAHGRRAAAGARGDRARPGPLRHPLRRRGRDPGDLPPRRPPRPPLPRRRALRRPLHRPRLRQADGPQRRRRLPRGRRHRRRPPGPPGRRRRPRARPGGAGPGRARPRRAGRRRQRAPPPAPSPGTRPPASPSTSTASCSRPGDDRRRDPLLALRRPHRLHPRSATRWSCGRSSPCAATRPRPGPAWPKTPRPLAPQVVQAFGPHRLRAPHPPFPPSP